jgi:uncharacterized protein (TIGR00255 family)
MALASMTGFADARGTHAGLRWRWEVRSVNGRALDIRLRTPPGFEGLEASARTLAAERFRRGSLQAVLTAAQEEGARALRVDPVALADAVKIAKRVHEETGLPQARVDGLLALRGVIVQDDLAALDDEARMKRDAAMLESLADAFDALAKARASEGAKIQAVLLSQVGEIETLTARARELAAAQPAALRERLEAQVAELMTGSLPEDRIAQEVALLAARADVREEMDRLTAHCQEARTLIGGKEPSGRKLDFLSQEFNREANTLCSKAADIALTRIGLALKAVIDQFREQVANVE